MEQFAADHPGWATAIVIALMCVPLVFFMVRKDDNDDQEQDSQTF